MQWNKRQTCLLVVECTHTLAHTYTRVKANLITAMKGSLDGFINGFNNCVGENSIMTFARPGLEERVSRSYL